MSNIDRKMQESTNATEKSDSPKTDQIAPEPNSVSEPTETSTEDSAANSRSETQLAQLNQELKQNLQELTADLQRTRADFENFRKNIDKEKAQVRKFAQFATIEKILPLLDDFERGIAAYPDLKPLEKNFAKVLKELKLEKIDSAPGTHFDPNFHEAVMTEGDGSQEQITETLRPGYLYEGEVLRAAMVKIC